VLDLAISNGLTADMQNEAVAVLRADVTTDTLLCAMCPNLDEGNVLVLWLLMQIPETSQVSTIRQ
jgi:hypothetical protein